jgi:hypothetical protein
LLTLFMDVYWTQLLYLPGKGLAKPPLASQLKNKRTKISKTGPKLSFEFFFSLVN